MKKLDFSEDRRENPFFYELVRFNYEKNLDRARGRYVLEGKENEALVGALIVKDGSGLEELKQNHVRDDLKFEIIDKDISHYIKMVERFDGAILIDEERISEPVLLYNVFSRYQKNTATLDQELSRFVPDDFIYQDAENRGFFGDEVPVGRLLGGRTRLAIILPQIYDGKLKTYAIKRTTCGRRGTGAVVMFGENGLERMCFFDQKNYEGGTTAVVRSYEFDPAQGKVVETGEFEFNPAVLKAHEIPVREYVDTFA